MVAEVSRCAWGEHPISTAYHDAEWGKPAHDDRYLFEMLVLESAQAGLSWTTILRKRDAYRRAFFDFDPERVAEMTDAEAEHLLRESEIVRHRAKVEATIANARAFLDVACECGSFDAFLWQRVGGVPIVRRPRSAHDVPARAPIGDEFAKALRARGFRFVGPTICYAYLQAVGVVNDHVRSCFACPA